MKHALAESMCTSRLDLGQDNYVTPYFLKKPIGLQTTLHLLGALHSASLDTWCPEEYRPTLDGR